MDSDDAQVWRDLVVVSTSAERDGLTMPILDESYAPRLEICHHRKKWHNKNLSLQYTSHRITEASASSIEANYINSIRKLVQKGKYIDPLQIITLETFLR
jgi:hypothetical protein